MTGTSLQREDRVGHLSFDQSGQESWRVARGSGGRIVAGGELYRFE